MKTLIVTASSKSKRDQSSIPFSYSKNTFVNSIGEKYREIVITSREELLDELNIEIGPDIVGGNIKTSDDEFLPAFIRYSGRTYSKISDQAWQNLVNQPEKYDCIILTALYGMIRFDEPIRNYEIKQADRIPNKSTIKSYWKNKGAMDWLFDYIKRNDIDDVKFVLSTSYADIIQRDKFMQRLDDELGISSEDQQFKTQGRKSMLLRGQYINDLLVGND